ncbi:hypothetical protein [Gallibacterium sp. ZY190522]
MNNKEADKFRGVAKMVKQWLRISKARFGFYLFDIARLFKIKQDFVRNKQD